MTHGYWGKVLSDDSVILPAELCQEYGIEDGSDVILSLTPSGILITPSNDAAERTGHE
jgi:antitoxin component of MazEF toxin-antitoxin module